MVITMKGRFSHFFAEMWDTKTCSESTLLIILLGEKDLKWQKKFK